MFRSPNIVRVIKSIRLSWADHVARMEESKSALKMYQANLQQNEFTKAKARLVDNISTYLKEIRVNTRDWIN